MMMMMMKKMQHQRQRQQQADHANGEQPELGARGQVAASPRSSSSHPRWVRTPPPVSEALGGVRGLERMLLARCHLRKGEMRDSHSALLFGP